jgi:integrase
MCWDKDPMLIRVMWQLARRENPTWQLDVPKTKKSRRDVKMNPLVYEILCQRRGVPMTTSVPIWGSDRTVDNLVFTNPKGKPINPQTLRNHFQAALVADGLPLDTNIHDLRHTFTSLCLDKWRAAGSALGCSGAFLNRADQRHLYGHLARKTLSQAPDAIHTVLNGKPEPTEENDEEETANQILQPTEETMQRVLGKGKVG